MASTHTQQSVTVFNTTVSAEEAEQTLLETDTDMAETTADRLVYYPYRVFGFDLHAEAFLDDFTDRVYCGVDLCNGKEVFIEEAPQTTEQVVNADMIVPVKDETKDVERIARYYLLELVRKELRVGSPPDLHVVEDYRIYRPFHLVDCTTSDETSLTYIVDSVTGDFHRVYLH
ncbi:hypothetical protein ACFFQF_16230 [Haladaptatus pallidirubidus]|uniref:Halobacterial output domain-containing protein n=1 Tax=Haladaptatus pallidirubidus TaxID=1008152 RepID=A0AAV3URH6_9EURY|nr:hypothetical protein [Haladaptatus pallidirubidus]